MDKLKLAVRGTLLLGVLLGWLWWTHRPTPPIITHPTPTTTVVEVPKFTEKVVKEFVTDPTQAKLIEALLKENKTLNLEVSALSSTVAILRTEGEVGKNAGTITEINPIATPPETTAGVVPQGPPSRSFKFTDFQLQAEYSADGKRFGYNLIQEFSIVTSRARDKEGHPVDLVKLYQKTPRGPVELSSVTTALEIQTSQSGWHLDPRIQAGLGLPKSGIVAAQWLRRGISKATEDSTISVLSPGLKVTADSVTPVLIPINFNLGHIKHSPFTNLWVGPTVDLDKHVGVAMTATF